MLEIVRKAALTVLEIITALLLLRAVLSWFPGRRTTRLDEVLYTLTEPILLPFRTLFSRFRFAQQFPLDLSFLAAIITIQILTRLLIRY